MDELAIGFWGAYFGVAALLLIGSLVGLVQSHHRVALAAAVSSLISTLFVLAYLGWLPLPDHGIRDRVLAHIAIASACVLALLLWAMLGLLRPAQVARHVEIRVALFAAAALAATWLGDPLHALMFGSMVAIAMALAGLWIGIRSAVRGDRLAWIGVVGVTFMLAALGGLSWIALHRDGVPLAVHLGSALAGTAYLVAMATMVWLRYSHLIELREVLAQGARYDPITRMRSKAETGHMLGLAFFRQRQDATRPLGVIVASIGNFYALENLHGHSAVHHALFVCASRLRRCVPGDVEMGRLADDGFLLVVRGASHLSRLVQLGRVVAEQLSRPVSLSSSAAENDLQAGQTTWVAQVGVGLLAATAQATPSAVVAKARDMSRTAWSYASRVAWHDVENGQITELPESEIF